MDCPGYTEFKIFCHFSMVCPMVQFFPRNVAPPHIHFPRLFPFDSHLPTVRRVLPRLNCHVFHSFILRRTAVSVCQKLNFNRLSINVIRAECLPTSFPRFLLNFSDNRLIPRLLILHRYHIARSASFFAPCVLICCGTKSVPHSSFRHTIPAPA